MITIRNFSFSDLGEVMKIEKASFPNQKAWSKKYFEKIYQKYPKEFLVAKIERKIVGYIIGQKELKETKIISLAIAPKWRKKGIGTILIKFLINYFKKEGVNPVRKGGTLNPTPLEVLISNRGLSNGVKKISLHTRTKNKIGILFFKKLDFEISKKSKNYYRNGDDAYLMRRKI